MSGLQKWLDWSTVFKGCWSAYHFSWIQKQCERHDRVLHQTPLLRRDLQVIVIKEHLSRSWKTLDKTFSSKVLFLLVIKGVGCTVKFDFLFKIRLWAQKMNIFSLKTELRFIKASWGFNLLSIFSKYISIVSFVFEHQFSNNLELESDQRRSSAEASYSEKQKENNVESMIKLIFQMCQIYPITEKGPSRVIFTLQYEHSHIHLCT